MFNENMQLVYSTTHYQRLKIGSNSNLLGDSAHVSFEFKMLNKFSCPETLEDVTCLGDFSAKVREFLLLVT